MPWETHPVTPDRFDDFADVVNPNRRASHCWCLSHRIGAREIEELGDGSREQAIRRLCERAPAGVPGPSLHEAKRSAQGRGGVLGGGRQGGTVGPPHAPGVVTYRDGEPVGWCSISPRAEIPRLVASKLIRPVDDVPVWSIICTVVRGGRRRQGVTTHLLEGAVAHAAAQGAPAVEAYPVDPDGRMDLTMAFVGTRAMFEKVGFEVIGQTDAVASKMPRLVMRRVL